MSSLLKYNFQLDTTKQNYKTKHSKHTVHDKYAEENERFQCDSLIL